MMKEKEPQSLTKNDIRQMGYLLASGLDDIKPNSDFTGIFNLSWVIKGRRINLQVSIIENEDHSDERI